MFVAQQQAVIEEEEPTKIEEQDAKPARGDDGVDEKHFRFPIQLELQSPS